MLKQIISLTKGKSPGLFNLISTSETIKIISLAGNFLDVYEDDLITIKDINVQDEINNSIQSPICPCCGRKIDRNLIKDYRDNRGTLGSTVNCGDCRYIDNANFYKLFASEETEKPKLLASMYKKYTL